MHLPWKCWSLLALALSLASFVWAGQISLQLQASVNATEAGLDASIQFTNQGNEPALELIPVLWHQGRPHYLQSTPQLVPGQSFTFAYHHDQHGFEHPGLYLIPLHLYYRDPGRARFKMAYILRVIYQKEHPSGLRWEIQPVTLPREKELNVSLTNLDPWAKTITLSYTNVMSIDLALPLPDFYHLNARSLAGLQAEALPVEVWEGVKKLQDRRFSSRSEFERNLVQAIGQSQAVRYQALILGYVPVVIQLESNARKSWNLKIKHDTLWPNTYTAYLLAEYDHEKKHATELAPVALTVIPESSVMSPYFSRNVLTTSLIFLVILSLLFSYGPWLRKTLWQKHS